MNTPKFTLICFPQGKYNLKEKTFDKPTPLGALIESTKEHRIEIYPGAYVFDTQQGWQDMHRLCELLRRDRHEFLRLPFEGELYLGGLAASGEKLIRAGVTVLEYPQPE